jgi:hypothetical protein
MTTELSLFQRSEVQSQITVNLSSNAITLKKIGLDYDLSILGYSAVLIGKQTFNTGLGAVYVPSILHMLQVSVRHRIINKGITNSKLLQLGSSWNEHKLGVKRRDGHIPKLHLPQFQCCHY